MNFLTQIKTVSRSVVTSTNITTIRVTKRGTIPISSPLSSCAKNVVILQYLKSASLISLGHVG